MCPLPPARLKLSKRTVSFYLFLETSLLFVPIGMFLANQTVYPLRDHMVLIGIDSQRFIVALCQPVTSIKPSVLINIIWWRIQHNLAKNVVHSRVQNRARKPGRRQAVTSTAKETMLARVSLTHSETGNMRKSLPCKKRKRT